MNMNIGEARRMLCATFFLLLAIGAAGGAVMAFGEALAALGDERWPKAGLLAEAVVALIPVFLWSWARMRRYRTEEKIPERLRAAAAHPDARQRFQLALGGFLFAAPAIWFMVGFLLGASQALENPTAGIAAQQVTMVLTLSAVGVFLA